MGEGGFELGAGGGGYEGEAEEVGEGRVFGRTFWVLGAALGIVVGLGWWNVGA